MRTKFKKWAVDYLNESKNIFNINDEDLLKYITSKKTYLEIGPGKGKFIIELASKNHDVNFLVVEINQTIAGICLKNIDDSNLTNIKLIADDFYRLTEILPQKIFEGIFLNFSDPWPKKRHEKRRLTSPLFLINYAKILKDDKFIYFKTDNDGFYEYSKEMFLKYNFEIIYDNTDYKEDYEFDAYTEFENKYISEGIKIKKMILKKGSNTIYEVIE